MENGVRVIQILWVIKIMQMVFYLFSDSANVLNCGVTVTFICLLSLLFYLP